MLILIPIITIIVIVVMIMVIIRILFIIKTKWYIDHMNKCYNFVNTDIKKKKNIICTPINNTKSEANEWETLKLIISKKETAWWRLWNYWYLEHRLEIRDLDVSKISNLEFSFLWFFFVRLWIWSSFVFHFVFERHLVTKLQKKNLLWFYDDAKQETLSF